MIRINLLPVRAAKKRELGKMQIALGVAVVLLAGFGNWLWYEREQGVLDEYRAEVRGTQAEIRQLEEIIGQVKDIEERKEQVNAKLEVLEDLRVRTMGPVRMLDALASLIPNEVWISRFSESGMTLSLDGSALEHEHLAAFIRALDSSPYFQDIQLRSATVQQRGDDKTVRFSIVGRVVYST